MLLFHFAHGTYQTPAGVHLATSISQSSVSRALHEIRPVFIEHMMPEYVRFPRTALEAQTYENPTFPGVIGAVDGTHIEIVTPADSVDELARLFRNRKGILSLNVMAVASFSHKYLAVNARYPGSVHNSAIWQLSQTRAFLMQNFIAGTPIGVLLADRGYPCEPWLLTPDEDTATESVRAYNRALKDLRKEIELTFGETKNCWRCLLRHRVLHYSPKAWITCFCMTLHNIRLAFNVNTVNTRV